MGDGFLQLLNKAEYYYRSIETVVTLAQLANMMAHIERADAWIVVATPPITAFGCAHE